MKLTLKKPRNKVKKEAIIQNRTRRLEHWRSRKVELLEKMIAHNPLISLT